jgi:hypothetical protein
MKQRFTVPAVACLIAGLSFSAIAAKPVDDNGVPFGNGFPSGPHYNLNLLGKKSDFNCPMPDYDESGNQVYGNVIFLPREQGNDPITVLMESGSKGPKGAQDTSKLAVTDWCTESFPDFGQNKGDGAVLRLPKHDAGYAVYARITGKPSKDDGGPSVQIVPDLVYVEDEAGNDLILLGLVDRNGTATFASTCETLTRYDTSTSGKGAQKATNLTGLFEWSCEVCYLQEDVDSYCLDGAGNNICTNLDLCCVDMDSDGLYERCDALADVGEFVDDGSGTTILQCPTTWTDSVTGLTYPYVTDSAQCRSYDNEWVFNIGDFVGYLWDLDTTGAYNIQVRFYPL